MPLQIIEHPLAKHLMAKLHDRHTPPDHYRYIAYDLAKILAVEATRDLATRPVLVETPLQNTTCQHLASPIVVVAILRAGISMVKPITDMFPNVSVGFIGMQRDEKTAEATEYYANLPSLKDKEIFLVDPMLATGGSALQALKDLYERGAKSVRFLNFIAAPEGVGLLEKHYPDLPIYSVDLDPQLNAHKYIVPGLGDFGDRLYGTLD